MSVGMACKVANDIFALRNYRSERLTVIWIDTEVVSTPLLRI